MDGEREQAEKGFTRRVYSPHDVAERMGISGQRLRQLARSYERARGDLPRDERGRVWPEEDVEELERARELVRTGRAGGIEQALRGELVPEGSEVPPATRTPSAGDIAAVAGELRAMRQAIEEQTRIMESMASRLEASERELRELRASVSLPSTDRELETHDDAQAAQEEETPVPTPDDAGGDPNLQPHAHDDALIQEKPDRGTRSREEDLRGPWRRVRRLLGL